MVVKRMLKTLNQRVSIVLLLIAIGYLVKTFQLPKFAYTEVDADMIPMVLGFLLVVLAVGLYFSKDSETEEQKARRDIPKKDVIAIIAVFAFVFVYILFLEILGFVVMTAIFIFFCSWFLGFKRYIANVLTSILFPLCMYFAFTEFLKISLPSGILPF
jgi:putative tricarboxylic transport membrane protein